MTEIRYMISDASKQLGVEPHVLRYWEEELSMPIKRNEMGHRYYTEEDMRVLRCIRDMKNQGFQLKAIKHVLGELYKNSTWDVTRLISSREGTEQEDMERIHQKVVAMQPQSTENTQEDLLLQGTQAEQLMLHMADRIGEKLSEAEHGFIPEDAADIFEQKDHEESADLVFIKKDQEALPEAKQEKPVQASETSYMMSAELKLEQFQEIMTRIIGKALESNNKSLSSSISSEVSDKVTDRVIKQMDYLMRENEEREEERFRKLDETIRQRQKANAEAAAALAEESKKKKKLRFGRRDKVKHRILS